MTRNSTTPRSAASVPLQPRVAPGWQRVYALRLVVTDLIALVWAIGGAALVVYDARSNYITIATGPFRFDLGYVKLTVILIVAWMLMLAAFGTRRSRLIGAGTAEYKAVLQASLTVIFAFVLLAFVFQTDISRLYTIVVAVAGTLALFLSRALWRLWLKARRSAGDYCQRVVIVASRDAAALLSSDLRRNTQAGYWIVGACVEGGQRGENLPLSGVKIFGGPSETQVAVRETNADTVLIADGHGLAPAEVRALSWSLEPGRQHLIVSPSLTDIAGPRLHSRPVAGLPLIHVETPRYEGPNRVLKRVFDVVGSLGLMVVLSPLLIPVAVLVAASSPGGIFFGHERIGKDGHPFHMLKFRSMIPNADAMLADLLAKQGSTGQPLFKITDDPRITPIGRFIRKYSIDEIPQLINVLRGDMSLVGPRPQVAREVALYDNAASRRLFVRPGMTGLWQVSGRSNLSWEESVRLDLFYVENWSMTADLGILYRTFRAVLASDGAV